MKKKKKYEKKKKRKKKKRKKEERSCLGLNDFGVICAGEVSNLVFYAQSNSTVISGRWCW